MSLWSNIYESERTLGCSGWGFWWVMTHTEKWYSHHTDVGIKHVKSTNSIYCTVLLISRCHQIFWRGFQTQRSAHRSDHIFTCRCTTGKLPEIIHLTSGLKDRVFPTAHLCPLAITTTNCILSTLTFLPLKKDEGGVIFFSIQWHLHIADHINTRELLLAEPAAAQCEGHGLCFRGAEISPFKDASRCVYGWFCIDGVTRVAKFWEFSM